MSISWYIFRKLVLPNLTRSISVSAVVQMRKTNLKCTLIPGDGVGPDLCRCIKDVYQAAEVPVDFEELDMSEVNPEKSTPLETVVASILKNGVCLKGVLVVPDISKTGETQNLNRLFRTTLDIYAGVVNIKSLPGVKCKHSQVDNVVIREQTEGEYSALEHESVDGVVECLKIVTGEKSRRIAKFAFDYATKHKRKKVTCVHKANIMKLGDGLFLRSCEEMSTLYPKIEFEKMIVDNCTMQMVSNPEQFDVMVTPNLYGNIINNLASGLVGGAGIVAGASYSSGCVVFQPGARHAFEEGVGKEIANPTAMLLCSVALLHHLHLANYAVRINDAINKVLMEGKVRTRDIGGTSSTFEYATHIMKQIKPK